jgi:photosystem II stability/assembly factor-like uncharacterized protein
MQKRIFDLALAVLLSIMVLFGLFHLIGNDTDLSAAPLATPPTINEITPSSGPNDLDTPIVITGTDFVSTPMVYVGETALDDVSWMSATRLEGVVPWGLEPGVYTLTVENPGDGSASLTDAFTVTEAIGVWNATDLYGGGIEQVAVVSQTPQVLYAVAEEVGMFRSEDGAETWSFQVAGSAGNLAVSPVSPTVLYMSISYELHRSDDGGDTWVPLDTSGQIPFPHPTDSGTLFASRRQDNDSGLWKSTDYGNTWQAITAAHGLTETRVNNLVFQPTDPLTIYVGTEEGNLFTSSDGGDSWSFVDHPLEYIQTLGINPRGDHELWASNCCFCNPNTTLRSTNVTHTEWTTVAEPVGSMPLTSIEFAPDGWSDTYSQTLFVSDCWDDVQKSEDNGASWTSIDPQTDEWHWGLGLHPTDPGVLYATGSQQGMYKTTDGGSTWQVAHEGLTAVVPDQMATVPGEPGTVYAVTDIGLLKGTQGGATWQSLSAGLGNHGFVATDPFTPGRVYAAGGDVGMGSDIPIYISEDGGQTWPDTGYLTEPAEYDQYVHGNPIIQPDPSQPGVLLAGVRHVVIEPGGAEAGSLYHSTDAGLTWSEVDVGQPISPVQDIAFDVLTPTIIYVATGGEWHNVGGLVRSTDGGDTWQRINDPALDQYSVESVAVEPNAPYRVVVRTGWPDMAVYVSAEHGAAGSWTKGGFGGDGDLLFTQDAASTLYGTSTTSGLFRSTDTGQSWEHASGMLGQVPVYSLATVTDTERVFLYAGTTGGRVQATGLQAQGIAAEETLVNAGVYRYTSRSLQVYLPVVLSSYGP